MTPVRYDRAPAGFLPQAPTVPPTTYLSLAGLDFEWDAHKATENRVGRAAGGPEERGGQPRRHGAGLATIRVGAVCGDHHRCHDRATVAPCGKHQADQVDRCLTDRELGVAVRAGCDGYEVRVTLSNGETYGVDVSGSAKRWGLLREDLRRVQIRAGGTRLHWPWLGSEISVATIIGTTEDRLAALRVESAPKRCHQ